MGSPVLGLSRRTLSKGGQERRFGLAGGQSRYEGQVPSDEFYGSTSACESAVVVTGPVTLNGDGVEIESIDSDGTILVPGKLTNGSGVDDPYLGVPNQPIPGPYFDLNFSGVKPAGSGLRASRGFRAGHIRIRSRFVSVQHAVERSPVDTQDLSSPGHVAVGPGDDVLNVLPFDVFERNEQLGEHGIPPMAALELL